MGEQNVLTKTAEHVVDTVKSVIGNVAEKVDSLLSHHDDEPAAAPHETKPATAPPTKRRNFAAMSKAELYEVAKERGVEGRSKMTKEQLLAAVRQ